MKVFVYFNLHRKCFSIKALEGENKGKVIAHRESVLLYKPTFKVSEAGRQRVLREKRKNVHAGCIGQWMDGIYDDAIVDSGIVTGSAVTYNPYKYDSFVHLYGEYKADLDYRCAFLSVINKKARINVEPSYNA